jgi:hypothetical protein
MKTPDFDLNEADKELLKNGYTYFGPALSDRGPCPPHLFQKSAHDGEGKIFWNVQRWDLSRLTSQVRGASYEVEMCYRTASDKGWIKVMYYGLSPEKLVKDLPYYEARLLETYRVTNGRPQE